VLDRPETAASTEFSFSDEEVIRERDVGGRFHRFSLSGGFEACGTVIHHAHMTLHGLSHLALCIKGLIMGLSGRRGKLIMHQCFRPVIDQEACSRCGSCIEACPEEALMEGEDEAPGLRVSRCIGCGECMAVCPCNAIKMEGKEITDWMKGADSLPYRMIDYLIGIMEGRWENVVYIAHLYDITRLCDCVNQGQKPICENIGFLVERNPFAVDRAARQIVEKELAGREGKSIAAYHPDDSGYKIFEYARKIYGVIMEPEIEALKV
jgi:uncharacterized Fe-S center protein